MLAKKKATHGIVLVAAVFHIQALGACRVKISSRMNSEGQGPVLLTLRRGFVICGRGLGFVRGALLARRKDTFESGSATRPMWHPAPFASLRKRISLLIELLNVGTQ